MAHIQLTHFWLANIFFLSSVFMTLVWVMKKHKNEVLNVTIGKILYRLEMGLSGLLPLAGVWLLIENPIWWKFPRFHLKLTLGIIAIGLIHWANLRMRKFIKGKSSSWKSVTYIRVIALLLMIFTYNYGLKLIGYAQM